MSLICYMLSWNRLCVPYTVRTGQCKINSSIIIEFDLTYTFHGTGWNNNKSSLIQFFCMELTNIQKFCSVLFQIPITIKYIRYTAVIFLIVCDALPFPSQAHIGWPHILIFCLDKSVCLSSGKPFSSKTSARGLSQHTIFLVYVTLCISILSIGHDKKLDVENWRTNN